MEAPPTLGPVGVGVGAGVGASVGVGVGVKVGVGATAEEGEPSSPQPANVAMLKVRHPRSRKLWKCRGAFHVLSP